MAGRPGLIGGCDGLIPAHPPREADHYHAVANPAKGEPPAERGLNMGYRPGRKTTRRKARP